MAYIVTTKRRYHEGANLSDGSAYLSVSRRAVATLEEARTAANDAVMHGPPPWDSAALAWVDQFPESGGTVGPLSDGTVIEVEQTTYGALIEATDLMLGYLSRANAGSASAMRRILDAYNARQS